MQCEKPLFIFILWFDFFILNSVLPSCYDEYLNLRTEYRENYLNHQHPNNNRKNCLQGKGEIMVPSHFGMFFHELIYFSRLKSYPHHTLAVTSKSAHWIWDATDILTTISTIERRGRGMRLCFHSPFYSLFKQLANLIVWSNSCHSFLWSMLEKLLCNGIATPSMKWMFRCQNLHKLSPIFDVILFLVMYAYLLMVLCD